jgi:hypothetical protein
VLTREIMRGQSSADALALLLPPPLPPLLQQQQPRLFFDMSFYSVCFRS